MEVADKVSRERSGRRRGVGERGHTEFDETFYGVGYGGSAMTAMVVASAVPAWAVL